MNYQEFAQRLATRAEQPLLFVEAKALAGNKFADVGPVPSAGDPAAALNVVAAALARTREPFHFGRLLFYAGYLTEMGAPASSLAPIVGGRLAWFTALAARAARDQPDEQDLVKLADASAVRDPDAAAAILVVEPALMGAMTLLCRDRAALRTARGSAGLVDSARALGGNVIVAYFLAELLQSCDELPLIVLQPASRRGFRVRVDGVRNGFHLFVLLEAALFGTNGNGVLIGPPIAQENFDIARGARPVQGEHTMRAHLDYFNWSAWDGTAWLPDAPTRWIWGELPLSAIPEVHGQTVILIEAPRYQRNWDARLACALHPDHHPKVELEQALTERDVDGWLEVIANAPPSARQRMRYAGVAI